MKSSIFAWFPRGFLGSLLIISFFLSPLATVFAQEVSAEQIEQPTESVQISVPETQSLSTEQTSEELVIAPTEEQISSLETSTSPENLTTGLTENKKGLLKTDETTGALNYSFPIITPLGRNGLEPNLELNYNNQQANNYPNLIGYGWSINIPYIERINKTGTDKLYTNNFFYSSFSGELVLVSGTTYAPKVENGDFLKYVYDGASWTVTDKKGTVYKFGQNASSRQDDTTGTKVYKWMLEETRDLNNNYIKYEYFKDAGQIYPAKIKYIGNGATDGIFEVEFLRQTRTDTTKSYATAFLVATNYRINEIQTKVNGNWVRKYNLAYTTGDNGVRSLLASITEEGRDEFGTVTTLEPTKFEYYKSTPGWSLDTTTYIAPPAFVDGYQSMLDINGDALPDVIESFNGVGVSARKNTYLNNNNGTWSLNQNLQPPILFREDENRGGHRSIWDQGVRMGDVNGDLLPDIIKSEDNSDKNKGGYDAYLNTSSSSWTQNNSWLPTVTFNGDDNIHNWGSYFIDLNGDGLLDITRKQGNYLSSQLNIGTGFATETTDWNPGVPELIGPIAQFVDVNGDNLPDVDYMVWDSFYAKFIRNVYIHKGDGTWYIDNSWLPPLDLIQGPNNEDRGLRFFDVNGDGLVDAVPQSSYVYSDAHTYLNTGVGWVSTPAWDVPLDPTVAFSSGVTSVTDLNADGSLDFFATRNSTPVLSIALINKTTTPTDTLKKVIFPQGGNTTITYKKTSKYVDASNNLLNPKLPISLDTVYSITTNGGFGTTSTETFSYEGGLYYFNTAIDRKLAGFAKVTKTDSAGNKTTSYFHQGNSINSAQGEYDDHPSKIGKIYRTEITDSSGNIYKKIINKWDKYNLGTGRDFVKLTQTVDMSYDGDSDHKDNAKTYTYDDTNGNLTEQIEWGEVTGSDDGSFSDVGNDKFTTDITYASNTILNILGLPKQEVTTDQSSNKIRESKYYYDTQIQGSVIKGNLTKEEKWKTGANYVNTQKAYNTYGLPTSSTDERGKVTSYAYDSHNLYPVSVVNPLSQVTSYIYDYSLGKPKQVTDANSRVFQTVYDGLDRVIEEKQPDLTTPSTLVTKTSYTYTDTPGAVSIQKIDYLDSSNSVVSYQYFDGLGRPIQDRVESESGYVAKDYIYNNVGLLQKESLPYDSSGTSRTTPTTNSSLFTIYTYDPMLRITSTTNAIGTITNTYDDWKATVTDLNGKVKHYSKDAYDNLIKVDETNSASTYSTLYEWNGNKKLTKITDALGNIRNFTYDGLGRRLTAEDLHAVADSTYGIWLYTYDDAGNMIQKVDPKNQTVNYTYDNLNRILTENYTGTAGTEVSYTYDSGTDGVGRLTSVATPDANTSYLYNPHGKVKQETKTINSTSYQTNYTFDRLSNILETTKPDSSKVKYTYNTAGQVENTQSKEPAGATFTDVVTDFDYGPHGKVIYEVNVNGAVTVNVFDSTKLYRLTRKLTTLPDGSKKQDLNYTYDNNGNITKIVDASNTDSAKTVDYIYDDLNRLTSAVATGVANGQSTYIHNYTYDALGNILTRAETTGAEGTKTYTYTYANTNYANPHAVTAVTVPSEVEGQVNTTNFTYDNNGNLTGEGAKIYTFDYNNRLVESSTPSSSPTTPSTVTNTFYPAKGDGSIYKTNSNWTTAHNAASGTSAPYTGATINVRTGKSGSNYLIDRVFLPFDTLSIPDDAVISEAKLKVYVSSKLNNDNDENDFVTVVQTTEPSVTKLTTADFDLAGSVMNPTEGIDVGERKDITSVATNAFLTFNLNTTGKNWISKTATTKLGLREGHDTLNNSFVGTAGQYNQLSIRSGEYSGTTYDPILEVTYTSLSTPPTPTIISYAYDHNGERVKMTTPTKTTVYPNKYYNTDGTKKTNHIYANGNLIATIETIDSITTPYYIHTDHLASANVVTDGAGIQVELLDYYPYGNTRISSGTHTNQRQYIGEMYDTDTGLNYLNARYYDSKKGQFISQDPMFWALPPELLFDPQQQNSYSYARGNPINGSDPSGLLTLIAPGTNYNKQDWSATGGAKNFISAVGKTFGETPQILSWSGGDNRYARQQAANSAVDMIKNHNFADGEKLNIIGHSHGGNIGVLVSELTDKKIDNLVTLGTPVRNDYKPNYSMIDNHVNAYNNSDGIQKAGGNMIKASGVAGLIIGGLAGGPVGALAGLMVGNAIGWGEGGFAGNTFSGAQNIAIPAGNSHSSFWGNPSVWPEVSKKIK